MRPFETVQGRAQRAIDNRPYDNPSVSLRLTPSRCGSVTRRLWLATGKPFTPAAPLRYLTQGRHGTVRRCGARRAADCRPYGEDVEGADVDGGRVIIAPTIFRHLPPPVGGEGDEGAVVGTGFIPSAMERINAFPTVQDEGAEERR